MSKTNPTHYAIGATCPNCGVDIEAIVLTRHLNFNRGNAVKYLARAGKKAGESEIDDLRKAAYYVANEIDRIENGTRND